MPRTQTQMEVRPVLPGLEESLYNWTVDELKWYAEALPGPTKTRKADIAAKVLSVLGDPKALRALWENLSQEQQWLIADVLHNGGGWCDLDRIEARYHGVTAPRGPRSRYSSYSVGGYYHDPYKKQSASAFDMFFAYRYDLGFYIPGQVAAMLLTFVPPPPPDHLASSPNPPILPTPQHLPEPPEIMRADAERSVFDDIAATLLLVQQGKGTVSANTQLPTLGTVRLLRQRLVGDDYFEDLDEQGYKRADEAVRPLALVMLMQAAKWAAPLSKGSTKLALTKAGQELLAGPVEPRHIREAWHAWVRSNLLDELSRVKGVKGQQSKDVRLTKPQERKSLVEEALRECPVGLWVEFSEFLRYMRSNDLLPQIERTSDSYLYVGYNSYYNNWDYQNYDYWEVVQGSYLRALVWEYAATLGMAEIAYTWPEDAPLGTNHTYSMYEDYLSRYDGLLAFRLTNLGAYALGLTDQYSLPEEAPVEGPPPVMLLPNLDIVITDARRVSGRDRAFFARIGTQQSQDVYHLSRDLLMELAESGSNLDRVKQFLEGKSGIEEARFPQTVRVFFSDLERRLNAVRERGRVLMLEGDEHVLTELAHTRSLRGTVQLGRVGDETILLVPESQEAAVRRQMKKMGYVPGKA